MSTIKLSDNEITVEGSVFLLDGCAYLSTPHGFYELPCEDFIERCREYVKEVPTLQASMIVRREQQDAPGRVFDYSIPLMTVSCHRESFHADRELCGIVASQEIDREFAQ